MRILPIVNYQTNKSESSLNNKKQTSFGEATIIARNADLLWDTASKYGYKQKYVVPFRKLLSQILQVPELKQASQSAPNNVEISTYVTDFSPSVFRIGVSKKGDSKFTQSFLVNPLGIKHSDDNQEIINYVGNGLAEGIKTIQS